jgi:hypothetical protein
MASLCLWSHPGLVGLYDQSFHLAVSRALTRLHQEVQCYGSAGLLSGIGQFGKVGLFRVTMRKGSS